MRNRLLEPVLETLDEWDDVDADDDLGWIAGVDEDAVPYDEIIQGMCPII